MCAYVNEITDVVNDFVNSGTMFTAFDVTMALRKKSRQNVQHYEVKREVHKLFNNGQMFSYDRALANLPNVDPQPWVYHPLSADISLYDGKPVASQATAVSAPVVAPQAIAVVDDVDDDNGTVVHKFDSTDRLCIPNRLVRQLGVKDSDPVTVSCLAQNELTITAGHVPGASPIADYHVDRYDNIRIGRSTFAKANINAVAFEIDGDNQKITVKKYA